mgnify:CR=1 FL=1
MSRKKKGIYKKKGNIVKDLTKNIFKILKEDSQKFYNYKQIAAKLKIHHTDGKTQLIKKLAELTASKQIKEVERGKFQVNVDRKYSIGTLDVTSNGNGYFISDDFEKDIFIPSNNLGKGLQNDTVKAYIYKMIDEERHLVNINQCPILTHLHSNLNNVNQRFLKSAFQKTPSVIPIAIGLPPLIFRCSTKFNSQTWYLSKVFIVFYI